MNRETTAGVKAHAIGARHIPSRQGFSPDLSLAYDSGLGNGPVGLGWTLTLPDIRRKTSKGVPRYHGFAEPDVFLWAGTEDLVPTLRPGPGGEWEADRFEAVGEDGAAFFVHRYRPRVERKFSRIERWEAQADGAVHWRAVTPSNVTRLFGRSAEARVVDPEDPARVFQWLLEERFDDRGNVIQYRYKREDAAGLLPGRLAEANRLRTGSAFAHRYLKRVL